MEIYECDECDCTLFKAQSGSFFCNRCGAIINSHRHQNLFLRRFFYIDENDKIIDCFIEITDGIIQCVDLLDSA